MPEERDGVLDVTDSAELRRLAEEVHRSGKPCILQRDGERLAMIVPVSAEGQQKRLPRSGKELTARDVADFYAAAGGWSDMDLDQFLADVYASRDQPSARPPVEL